MISSSNVLVSTDHFNIFKNSFTIEAIEGKGCHNAKV